MVTQELISYVTSELNKGKTREQIRTVLLSGGGWSNEDVEEVFKALPMDPKSSVQPAPKIIEPIKIERNPRELNTFRSADLSNFGVEKISQAHRNSKAKEIIVFVLIFGAILAAFSFFRPELSNAWSSLKGGVVKFSSNYFNRPDAQPKVAVQEPVTPVAVIPKIKDCGVSTAPDRKTPDKYQNDDVLKCLGASLISCDWSKAILTDPLFPTNLEVSQGDNCTFKLSYSSDSTLVDISGNKLAGQYVMCPVSVIKKMEEKNKTVTFTDPDKDPVSEYSAEAYFYGSLGLFIESNFNKTKISDLGCTGSFIDSMIASYNKAQSKK
jgi:hypothetical protein